MLSTRVVMYVQGPANISALVLNNVIAQSCVSQRNFNLPLKLMSEQQVILLMNHQTQVPTLKFQKGSGPHYIKDMQTSTQLLNIWK